MRNIISQIISLWDICRKERKNLNESDLTERTWRPWVSSYLYHLYKSFYLYIRNIYTQ